MAAGEQVTLLPVLLAEALPVETGSIITANKLPAELRLPAVIQVETFEAARMGLQLPVPLAREAVAMPMMAAAAVAAGTAAAVEPTMAQVAVAQAISEV